MPRSDLNATAAAGLPDEDYRRERRDRRRESEDYSRRLREGFAALNGEGVYVEDDSDDE